MRLFLIAMRFLTRIPLGPPLLPRPEELPRSVRMYPLVGLVIGGILAPAYLLLLGQAVLSPLFAGALLVALEAFLTGGIHLDGLMDTADGFSSGGDRARILAVMKDSRVGACGVLAAILVLLMKAGLFASLFAPAQAVVVAAMPVLGRWAAALLAGLYPHAGEGSLGGSIVGRVDRRDLAAGSGLCLLSLLAASSPALLAGGGGASFARGFLLLILLWAVAAAAALLFARAAARRLGGLTGDTVGAAVELCELAVLLAGTLLSGLMPPAPGGRP